VLPLALLLLSVLPQDITLRDQCDECVKITGRGCDQHPVPEHALAVRSQGMSEQQSSCALASEKSDGNYIHDSSN
jgi:hypothetical protein